MQGFRKLMKHQTSSHNNEKMQKQMETSEDQLKNLHLKQETKTSTAKRSHTFYF
jgi:hypothetical protein